MLVTALALALSMAAPEPQPRPNIVIILADDMGYSDLSCYGGRLVQTPQLDRMAREGIRFTRAYVAAPICSPSRCGLLTGQHPGRWRITSYLQKMAGNRACGQADYLDERAPSLPRALKAAGYATAHVGKWHLGGGRDVVDPPKFFAYGYDLGLGTWESPEPAPDLTARDWIWSAADKVKRWERTGWMVDQAIDFLKAYRDKPCFVNLWLDDPHTPWVPTEADQQARPGGRAEGKANTPSRLKGVLANLDRQVGRLLDFLRAGGNGRPTIVLFLSDNGPMPPFGDTRTGGLRGSKLSLYEGGIRVPLITWSPGLVPEGRVDSTTVISTLDFFPSLCRIAAAPLPEGYRPDGEDVSAALLNTPRARTGPLFWEYGRNPTSFDYPVGKNRSPNLAVLDGTRKLLVNDDGTGAELYEISSDPAESRDLSAVEPQTAVRLKAAALAWRRALP
ncbi:Arylsulfatase precursor [Aquisphaera giovannonii]|uniref:Arylsulfatase n=1 Tax=Aquisphaera giovannonii TaxID=406548 RepID=A0A5B9W0C1_9BACT|nr:sulfatase-like hydrolase/transferase [Aquisphaera giovannonii]QEH33998.1 Arylsulfatase precursor [Aquisphaera giovannonii]